MPIGHSREVDAGFYEWVRRQPEWRCCLTGLPHDPPLGHSVDRCHIRSRGAGGSDRWIMPLIREEHTKADTNDRQWWYRNRAAVCEWMVTLASLWERYDRERKCNTSN